MDSHSTSQPNQLSTEENDDDDEERHLRETDEEETDGEERQRTSLTVCNLLQYYQYCINRH